MNIKEFNEKKQGLIGRINLRLSQAAHLTDGTEYGYIVEGLALLDELKQLQPPTPPKCVTCRYLHDTADEWPRCEAWKGIQAISDMTNHDISDPEKMGCIYHSDYEVK